MFTPVFCAQGCGEAQELSLVFIPGNYTISNTRPNKDAEMFWQMYFPFLQSGLLLQNLLYHKVESGLISQVSEEKKHHVSRKLREEVFQNSPNRGIDEKTFYWLLLLN